MNNKKELHYNKFTLRFHLKGDSDPHCVRNFNIIANLIKQENEKLTKKLLYTKEELYLIGFDAFQIHKYFKLKKNNLWQLKPLIIIDDNVVESFSELCQTLKLNAHKIAS